MNLNIYTYETEEVILDPPAPPIKTSTLFLSSRIMVGHLDEIGIFCETIKFASAGEMPYEFTMSGNEKSSIPLLRMIPVRRDTILQPKLYNSKISFVYIKFEWFRNFSKLTNC